MAMDHALVSADSRWRKTRRRQAGQTVFDVPLSQLEQHARRWPEPIAADRRDSKIILAGDVPTACLSAAECRGGGEREVRSPFGRDGGIAALGEGPRLPSTCRIQSPTAPTLLPRARTELRQWTPSAAHVCGAFPARAYPARSPARRRGRIGGAAASIGVFSWRVSLMRTLATHCRFPTSV